MTMKKVSTAPRTVFSRPIAARRGETVAYALWPPRAPRGRRPAALDEEEEDDDDDDDDEEVSLTAVRTAGRLGTAGNEVIPARPIDIVRRGRTQCRGLFSRSDEPLSVYWVK